MDAIAGDTNWALPSSVRQARLLFVVAGALGMITSVIPGSLGYGMNSLRVINGVALVVAAVISRLPWARWSERTTLALVPVALTLISLSDRSGGVPAPIYGLWFMVTFVWIGMWHRSLTSLACAPVATVAYLLPFVTQSAPRGYVASVFIAIPAAVVLGEVMSRTCDAMRGAQEAQREAMTLLAKANLTDDLTGLGNRRQGNVLIDDLVPGDALLMLDLDHFKFVNDSQGHAAGDAVLADLGSFLESQIRGSDAVARFGGEEFIVTLRGAGMAGAEKAERLRAEWESRMPAATFSIGVAVHQLGRSPADTLCEADRALYAAKLRGRNAVVGAWALGEVVSQTTAN